MTYDFFVSWNDYHRVMTYIVNCVFRIKNFSLYKKSERNLDDLKLPLKCSVIILMKGIQGISSSFIIFLFKKTWKKPTYSQNDFNFDSHRFSPDVLSVDYCWYDIFFFYGQV